MPSGSTRLTAAFLYSLPPTVLKSSASVSDAEELLKLPLSLESSSLRAQPASFALHPRAYCRSFLTSYTANRVRHALPIVSFAFRKFPPMEDKQRLDVINFSWGSLPRDALNQQTMRKLQLIADRKAITSEQVISEALDWVLMAPEPTSSQAQRN